MVQSQEINNRITKLEQQLITVETQRQKDVLTDSLQRRRSVNATAQEVRESLKGQIKGLQNAQNIFNQGGVSEQQALDFATQFSEQEAQELARSIRREKTIREERVIAGKVLTFQEAQQQKNKKNFTTTRNSKSSTTTTSNKNPAITTATSSSTN